MDNSAPDVLSPARGMFGALLSAVANLRAAQAVPLVVAPVPAARSPGVSTSTQPSASQPRLSTRRTAEPGRRAGRDAQRPVPRHPSGNVHAMIDTAAGARRKQSLVGARQPECVSAGRCTRRGRCRARVCRLVSLACRGWGMPTQPVPWASSATPAGRPPDYGWSPPAAAWTRCAGRHAEHAQTREGLCGSSLAHFCG